jgi:nucleoside 2-deoxyribosyltransferase
MAIMDGPDPDSGTCWEVGYSFGLKKWIVLVRTDIRALAGSAGDYNLMLTEGDDPDRPARGVDDAGHRRDPRRTRADRNEERLG